MKQIQAVKHACRVLRHRVRFNSASISFPWNDWMHNDAPLIRESTKQYVETWIVPILDMIEKGDTKALHKFTAGDPGDDIESKP